MSCAQRYGLLCKRLVQDDPPGGAAPHGRAMVRKAAVIGAVERGGNVVALSCVAFWLGKMG
ncbi:MAG: hypothetical protein OXC47_00810 [Cyanobacteria bacterium MAG APA_bin_95]|nr:hypothetical protein [Cyanobacteria bacterium MAG APA_bin_95]